MTGFIRAWNRLLFWLRRSRLERDLVEELEMHRSLKYAEYQQVGVSSQEAQSQTRKQLGNLTLAKEECRESWRFMTLEHFFQDAKYAFRMFSRAPVFTAVATISLALGIGGNAAMFSLVNALLIQPLPYTHPEQLMRITGIYPRAAVSYFQAHSRTMRIGAVSRGSELNLTGEGVPVRLLGSAVSANFFSVLGVAVEQGRAFQEGEDEPGRDGVAIIGHHLWQTKFGRDSSILGRVITVGGVNRRIIGVLPERFAYPSTKVEMWFPLRLDSSNFLEYWGGEFVPFVARAKAGTNIATATSETRSLISQFRKTFPYPMSRDWNADVTVIPLQQDVVGDIRGKLLAMLASVGLVLLVACVNVASLLLARSTTRRKEVAVRTAIGAGRTRMVRQLVTESVVLSLCGAVLGLIVGTAALTIFKSVLPLSIPGLAAIHFDWPIVCSTALLALVSGVGFGIIPAISTSQVDLTDAIKTGSQRSTTGAWTKLRNSLVSAEVALTLVLVVSAGLLVRSMEKLAATDPGYEPANLISIRISPDQTTCERRASCVAFYDRVLQQARSLGGVTDASLANAVPLDGQLPTLPVDVEGHPKTADHPAPMLLTNAVSPGFLHMLRIPLLAGRTFTAGDAANSAPVLIVSAAAAKHFWPGENAIGKRIKSTSSGQWRTIVGVVGDVKQYTLSSGLPSWIPGALYMPYSQAVREDGQIPTDMTLIISGRTQSPELKAALRYVQDQDPNASVGAPENIGDIVSGSIAPLRAIMGLFSAFAATSLLLAAIGIYGLMAYWVSQRRYEIGLRIAVGATAQRIIVLILRQGLRATMYGIAAGLIASLLVTRFLSSLLYQTGATDASTFCIATALLIAVAIVATAFPAWRATGIDPVKSLRLD